jgi:hypothetical protein
LKLAIAQSYCPNCGTPFQQNSVFCPNCGTKTFAPRSQPQQLTSGYYPPATPAQVPVSKGPYKAVIGVLLIIIILLGVGFYAATSGHLFALSGYRYQLANPPNPQSIQPIHTPATLPPSAKTIWNACGVSAGQGCSMTANGWREGTIPDTYDYYVSFTSNVSITVYFFTLGQFVQFRVCNGDVSCVSGFYDSMPATTSQQTNVFRLAEGCGDYVAIYVASANGIMRPVVSVDQNPALSPTGYCAQAGTS